MTIRRNYLNYLFVLFLFIPLQMASGQGLIAICKQKPKPEYRWIAGIHPGGGYLLASTANNDNSMFEMGIPKYQANDFNKKLKRGWTVMGDIYYMFSYELGVGAKYSLFASSAQKDFTAAGSMQPVSQYVHVGMKEIQYIHYAGPSGIYRQWLDKKQNFQLTGTLSAGYVHYRKETRTDPTQYTVFHYILNRSNTWGAHAGISAAYFPISRLSVGISAGFKYAHLTTAKVQTKETARTVEFEKKDKQSLAQLDYSLMVRFHF